MKPRELSQSLLESVGLSFEYRSLAPGHALEFHSMLHVTGESHPRAGSVQGSGSLRGRLNTVNEKRLSPEQCEASPPRLPVWCLAGSFPGCFSSLCQSKCPSCKGSPAVCTELGLDRVRGESQDTICPVEKQSEPEAGTKDGGQERVGPWRRDGREPASIIRAESHKRWHP